MPRDLDNTIFIGESAFTYPIIQLSSGLLTTSLFFGHGIISRTRGCNSEPTAYQIPLLTFHLLPNDGSLITDIDNLISAHRWYVTDKTVVTI